VNSLSKLTRAIEALITFLLFCMFAMVAILVVLRYVFGTTIIGGNEATIIAFIYTTALGASVALSRDEHISINYFVENLSPVRQEQLGRARLLMLVIVNVVIAAYSVVWIRQTGGFMMPTLGLPQYVAQLSIPLGCGLGALYCGARLFQR
jgi:TRAP-type C4-dicarboxylate transport system permease small subunit